MRVTVNEDNCLGYGVCVTHSQRIFSVDDGVARVLLDPIPDDLTELAQAAVDECPASAITAIDDR